ncbi:MATE family efflux transporter (plasmid) [Photobacterium sp. GJ3]|uniref:MATE family efflux transporter n=1 Tax=Photobacterium sp. GJ3 TaxID=2829502 RepID=UPI001B8B8266|nr:MATE family efflux transporter [Photobacterium sp. GJ3]QUJ69563.1 MATE family efflux transporter [Photobacterium sp. GJ3]
MQLASRHLDRAFWQKLIHIGLPISLQAMLFSLLGVIDIFMVSQLGEQATAAVGVGNRIFFFNLLMIAGISGAVNILASQYVGAGNLDGVKRTLAQSWLMCVLSVLPFIALYGLMPATIVGWVASEPDYVHMAADYLWVTGPSFLLTAIVVPLEAVLRASGHARLPTYASIVAVIVNIVLNALLIFGLFGFPEMGVLGAGLGTAISRLVQTLILFYLALRSHRALFPNRTHWMQAWQKSHLKRYLKIAMPMMIHDTGWAAGIVVYNILVGQLGVSELAMIALLAPVESVLMSAFLGAAVGASIILGHELGAENYQRAEQTAWGYVLISCGVALLIAIGCWLAQPLLTQLMRLSPLENSTLAVHVCLVMAFGMVLKVFNMVGIGGVLKSGGDINYTIFIDLSAQWLIGIPLAYYTGLVLGWSLDWVMAAILLEEVVKIGLTSQRIQSKKWMNNLVREPQPAFETGRI